MSGLRAWASLASDKCVLVVCFVFCVFSFVVDVVSSFLHCMSSSITEAWKEDKAGTGACQQESTSNDKEDNLDDKNQDIILNNDKEEEEEDSNENLLDDTTIPAHKSTSGTHKKSASTR